MTETRATSRRARNMTWLKRFWGRFGGGGVDAPESPFVASKIIRTYFATRRFRDRKATPEAIAGFEDLAFLFGSSQANYALCLMTFEEAAYIYRLVHGLSAPAVVEIGRFKGGSTFLLAAAVGGDGHVDSYDLARRPSMSLVEDDEVSGTLLDDELSEALEQYKLGGRVTLHIADSRLATRPEDSVDVVIIDGDHEYENARADMLHWKDALRPGGHLLLHDAERVAPMIKGVPDLLRLVAEFERDHAGTFARAGTAGSLVHFVRL